MNPRVGKLRKCLVAWVAWKVIQTWTHDVKKYRRFSANDAATHSQLVLSWRCFRCFFHSVTFLCNQYFFYLFVEFPELLDSSYVQQFFLFQVDKDNVTINIDAFQAFKQLAADIQYQYWWISNPSKYWVNYPSELPGFRGPVPTPSIDCIGSEDQMNARLQRWIGVRCSMTS